MIRKITIRKSAFSLTALTMYLLISIAFFMGFFLYWNQNIADANLEMDSTYNKTYGNLSQAQETLENNVDDIKSNVEGIKEADNAVQATWNAIKGLGNTLKLPISFVDSTLDVYTGLNSGLGYLPKWAITTFEIALVALVVFLLLAILKGDPKL